MAESNLSAREKAFFEELDAFVDQAIDAMSPEEFREFDAKSEKTMAEIKRRASESCESRETQQPEPRALRA